MRRVTATMAGLGVLATLAVPVPADAQAAPSIKLSLDAATVGQTVAVSGRGFPVTTPMSLQVCGNNAVDGSTDCDVLAGQTVVANEVGSFESQVVVRFPPVPCPCVVWASASNGDGPAAVTAPIGVVTGNYATPTLPVPLPATGTTNTLEVLNASVRQNDAWQSWLGLPSHEELVLTVRNGGKTRIDHPFIALTLGRGSDPSQILASPTLAALDAGEQRTVVVPFHLGALAHGAYTVKGAVASAAGDTVVFRSPVSAFPWLLPVFALLAVLLIVVRHRRRGRRRSQELIETEEAEEAEPAIEVAVVDLTDIEVAPSVALPASRPIRVTFTYPSWIAADSVTVCGDFNGWVPDGHPLLRLDAGDWSVMLELEGGQSYRYRFLIDGDRWDNDWSPDAYVPNEFGSQDSLVLVGFKDRYANLDAERVHRISDGGNGNGRGHGTSAPPALTDDDWAAAFSSPSDDFWAETPDPLLVRLRRWRP